jgi:hypothetical protein
MLRVLNTLNGRCEARPIRGVSSPVERLLTVCLQGATMATFNMQREVIFVDKFLLYIDSCCPCLRGQPRCTWVIALPDSTRRLCLATKIFSSKRRDLTYLILYIAVLTHLIVRASLSWRENKKFLKKYSWKKVLKKILKKILKIFFERKIHRVESGRAYTHVHRGWHRKLGYRHHELRSFGFQYKKFEFYDDRDDRGVFSGYWGLYGYRGRSRTCDCSLKKFLREISIKSMRLSSSRVGESKSLCLLVTM